MNYQLHRVIPIASLTSSERKKLNIAIRIAEKSVFEKNKRLGAYLEGKGKDILRR